MAERPEHPHDSLAKAIFGSVSAMDDLRADGPLPAALPIGFAEMYRVATEPDCVPSAAFQAALKSNESFRRGFHSLLNKVSITHLPAVAAASSDRLEYREAGGMRVQLTESAADSAQIYVIIERVDDSVEMPGVIMIETAAGGFEKQLLPDPIDGVIQILLESDSAFLTALRDLEAVVYFR